MNIQEIWAVWTVTEEKTSGRHDDVKWMVDDGQEWSRMVRNGQWLTMATVIEVEVGHSPVDCFIALDNMTLKHTLITRSNQALLRLLGEMATKRRQAVFRNTRA